MKKILPIVVVLAIIFAAFYVYQKREAKVLFVGDMFFDRYIREVGYAKGGNYVFSCISHFLKDSDMVVGNLEGPITENASRSLLSAPGDSNNFTFTFPTATAGFLANNNVKLVDLGNNHIGNFGQEGIASTRKYLSEDKVNYFGGIGGDEPIYRTDISGQKVSFISYNEFGGDSAQNVAQKISDEKKNGQKVFVYAHWGDEYSPAPQRVKDIAKLFSQSGADLIVGSHPHVVQASEKIGNTDIYYSLGNFIFDQYWDKTVSTGLVLEVNIGSSDLTVVEHKVSLNPDGRTCLVN
jgi:gamma-polyglutamate biosynthesis protein CapA